MTLLLCGADLRHSAAAVHGRLTGTGHVQILSYMYKGTGQRLVWYNWQKCCQVDVGTATDRHARATLITLSVQTYRQVQLTPSNSTLTTTPTNPGDKHTDDRSARKARISLSSDCNEGCGSPLFSTPSATRCMVRLHQDNCLETVTDTLTQGRSLLKCTTCQHNHCV